MPPRSAQNPDFSAPSPDGQPPSSGLPTGRRWRAGLDWIALVRRLERKRRMLLRFRGKPGAALSNEPGATSGSPHLSPAAAALPLPADDYYARATWVSFRLEGIDIGLASVIDALTHGTSRPTLRSRQSQRLRNHASILRHLETSLRQPVSLTTDDVLRWYTTVGAGLPTTAMDPTALARLAEVMRRLNCAQPRVRSALKEIGQSYVRLIEDPLVPSFNGILSRLLLRYHLGKCGLPPIVLDPEQDRRFTSAASATYRLTELVEECYDRMLHQ